MKIVYISLEFSTGTFSGNGVLSQSQVRALRQLGHEVLVICGKPAGVDASSHLSTIEPGLIEIPLPIWGRLDRGSAWREFAKSIDAEIAKRVALFSPNWVLGVDWTSVNVYERLKETASEMRISLDRFCFLNFRVYTKSDYGADDKDFYREMETRAMTISAAAVAISRPDAEFLREISHRNVEVVFPPLRQSVYELAAVHTELAPQERRYFVCCVRLSPEKEAHRFADLVQHIKGFLIKNRIVPLLFGATGGSNNSYADGIKEKLKQSVENSEIIESFIGPEEMRDIFQASLINFHPPTYDAYGMTVIEAASFGVPSFIHHVDKASVGAAEFLQNDEFFALDMLQPIGTLAESITAILSDIETIGRTGEASRARALSWTERANAAALVDILK